MRTRRVGRVARRIAEKMNASLADLSVIELARHVYDGDASPAHRREIRRALGNMEYPDGWSLVPGIDMRVTRHPKQKLRYFNQARSKSLIPR